VLMTASTARLALVGNRSPQVRAHVRIPALLEALRDREQLDLDPYWISTEDITEERSLDGFDGIWIVPGSPYRSEAGAITAARFAREHGVPLLGTCGGFQHAVLEFARNVCGLAGVQHGENVPDAEDLLVVPLACSLAGHEEEVRVTPGSLAEAILGAERTSGRYSCSYGLNAGYVDVLQAHGLRITGVDLAGEPRIAELPDHPFYLLTLFQPELAGEVTDPHRLIRAFAAAVTGHPSVVGGRQNVAA
jgi:CTP synthase (UTP-ammonia lyase)